MQIELNELQWQLIKQDPKETDDIMKVSRADVGERELYR
jgi:hypothetical protein